MNEVAVRNAIKTLISDNNAVLMTDLTFQGNPRTIHQIVTSSLTPPTGYYFVSVTVSSAKAAVRTGMGKTVSVPPSEARYDVVIELSDYAIASPSEEDNIFEKMDADFQLFSDRIVSLLRADRWITDDVSVSQFRLGNERAVTKNNLGTIWEEAAQYHAMLYCRITFQLLEECTDDDKLY